MYIWLADIYNERGEPFLNVGVAVSHNDALADSVGYSLPGCLTVHHAGFPQRHWLTDDPGVWFPVSMRVDLN